MSEENNKKPTRREFIHIATTAVGAVGAGCIELPLVTQMNPDASVKALAKVEVDISKIEKGNEVTIMWRGKPIFIRRRTDEEVQKAREVKIEDLKDPQKDQERVKKGKDEDMPGNAYLYQPKERVKYLHEDKIALENHSFFKAVATLLEARGCDFYFTSMERIDLKYEDVFCTQQRNCPRRCAQINRYGW